MSLKPRQRVGRQLFETKVPRFDSGFLPVGDNSVWYVRHIHPVSPPFVVSDSSDRIPPTTAAFSPHFLPLSVNNVALLFRQIFQAPLWPLPRWRDRLVSSGCSTLTSVGGGGVHSSTLVSLSSPLLGFLCVFYAST